MGKSLCFCIAVFFIVLFKPITSYGQNSASFSTTSIFNEDELEIKSLLIKERLYIENVCPSKTFVDNFSDPFCDKRGNDFRCLMTFDCTHQNPKTVNDDIKSLNQKIKNIFSNNSQNKNNYNVIANIKSEHAGSFARQISANERKISYVEEASKGQDIGPIESVTVELPSIVTPTNQISSFKTIESFKSQDSDIKIESELKKIERTPIISQNGFADQEYILTKSNTEVSPSLVTPIQKKSNIANLKKISQNNNKELPKEGPTIKQQTTFKNNPQSTPKRILKSPQKTKKGHKKILHPWELEISAISTSNNQKTNSRTFEISWSPYLKLWNTIDIGFSIGNHFLKSQFERQTTADTFPIIDTSANLKVFFNDVFIIGGYGKQFWLAPSNKNNANYSTISYGIGTKFKKAFFNTIFLKFSDIQNDKKNKEIRIGLSFSL